MSSLVQGCIKEKLLGQGRGPSPGQMLWERPDMGDLRITGADGQVHLLEKGIKDSEHCGDFISENQRGQVICVASHS